MYCISDNNDNNMILVGTLCFLSTLHQLLAALHGLSGPRQASGCQDHVGLLIIGVGPIKKHDALKNHVIV